MIPFAAHAVDYATVISATPVSATVDAPRRVCTDEQQYVGARPSGAGAVIGAIAGGVLGNSVGGGFGRAAATGIGAVAGAAIGNSVETNAANAYPPTAVPVQRCQMVGGYESRLIGYDVVYDYAGQRYMSRMASDPGPTLAIDVRPARGAAQDYPEAAQPPAAYDPRPVYTPQAVYAPQPAYYGYGPVVVAPPVYVGPSFGFYYGGYGGHRGRWH